MSQRLQEKGVARLWERGGQLTTLTNPGEWGSLPAQSSLTCLSQPTDGPPQQIMGPQAALLTLAVSGRATSSVPVAMPLPLPERTVSFQSTLSWSLHSSILCQEQGKHWEMAGYSTAWPGRGFP